MKERQHERAYDSENGKTIVGRACMYGLNRIGEGTQTRAEHGHGNQTITIRFDPELCILLRDAMGIVLGHCTRTEPK